MGYELRTNVVDPERNTFSYLVERFGDRPATRWQIQPVEAFDSTSSVNNSEGFFQL